jgi:hypothetical protein
MDDGYMGSGKIIKYAIEKYGIENFSKTILETFSNSEDMFLKELEVATDEFLQRDNLYNLRQGGIGVFDYINANGLNYKGFETVKERNTAISPFSRPENFTQEHLDEIKRKRKGAFLDPRIAQKRLDNLKKATEKLKEDPIQYAEFQRRRNEAASTEEARLKKKQTLADIGHQQGSKNSQYEKCCITHPELGNQEEC